MKRFAILLAETSEVLTVHAKDDNQPPVPRMSGYEVIEIGNLDVKPGMIRQADGSFKPSPPLPNVQRRNNRTGLWEIVAPDGSVFKTNARRFPGLEVVKA